MGGSKQSRILFVYELRSIGEKNAFHIFLSCSKLNFSNRQDLFNCCRLYLCSSSGLFWLRCWGNLRCWLRLDLFRVFDFLFLLLFRLFRSLLDCFFVLFLNSLCWCFLIPLLFPVLLFFEILLLLSLLPIIFRLLWLFRSLRCIRLFCRLLTHLCKRIILNPYGTQVIS